MRDYVMFEGQAVGAIPNGRRIRKIAEDGPGETPLGSEGVVLSSMATTPEILARLPPGTRRADFFYFVEWDRTPGMPIGVVDWKIEHA